MTDVDPVKSTWQRKGQEEKYKPRLENIQGGGLDQWLEIGCRTLPYARWEAGVLSQSPLHLNI